MIAQIQTSGSAPAATPSGAAKAPAAAQGFAALMRGQASVLAPQAAAKPQTSAPTAANETAGQEVANTPVPEGADALMDLMDKTIATLHQSAEQVTPKRVLAGFAEALGAPVPEQLGDLEALAQLADPELVTALQGKIDGALRLTAGVGQLSVASASVPAVGWGSSVASATAATPAAPEMAGTPMPRAANSAGGQATPAPITAATTATSILGAPAAAPADQEAVPTAAPPAANAPTDVPEALSTAQIAVNAKQAVGPQGGKAQNAATGDAAMPLQQAKTGQGKAAEAAPMQNAMAASVLTPANAAGAPAGLPPLDDLTEAAPQAAGAIAQPVAVQSPMRSLPAGRLAAMETGKAPATSPLALGAEAAVQGADPRTQMAEQIAPGAKAGDFAAQLPTGADTLSREAAQLAAPQSAPTPDAPRLAPPNPVPAPPPHPAAPPEEQLRQHVTQQIRGLETADNKLRFALSPYGMGEIEIEVVRLENGRMQIAMTTESAAVLNVLRQDREQLLEALQSRGLEADSADLDFQTFDDRGRGTGGDRFAPLSERAEGGASPEDPAQDIAPAPRMTSGPGQLDILT